MNEKDRLNKTGGDAQPNVGTDPMDPPQDAPEKPVVAPDPEKVRAHDREKARRPRSAEEAAEEVKNA